MIRMRRELVGLAFAGLAFLPPAIAAAPAVGEEVVAPPTAVAVQRVTVAYPVMREEAAMVLIGSALIALAAAVRRAA